MGPLHCRSCKCKPAKIVRLPRPGEKYRHPDGDLYVVATVRSHEYALINIESGNRWNDPSGLNTIRRELKRGSFKVEEN